MVIEMFGTIEDAWTPSSKLQKTFLPSFEIRQPCVLTLSLTFATTARRRDWKSPQYPLGGWETARPGVVPGGYSSAPLLWRDIRSCISR